MVVNDIRKKRPPQRYFTPAEDELVLTCDNIERYREVAKLLDRNESSVKERHKRLNSGSYKPVGRPSSKAASTPVSKAHKRPDWFVENTDRLLRLGR